MPRKPHVVPLADGAGEVDEIGTDVTRVKVGDRVAGCFFQRWIGGPPAADTHFSSLGGAIDGMLREYAVLEEDGVVKLPTHLSFEDGATLPCAAVTAWQALAQHPNRCGANRPRPGNGRRLDLRPAIRAAHGRAGDCHIVKRRKARPRK